VITNAQRAAGDVVGLRRNADFYFQNEDFVPRKRCAFVTTNAQRASYRSFQFRRVRRQRLCATSCPLWTCSATPHHAQGEVDREDEGDRLGVVFRENNGDIRAFR
jgi:hypothetical protein